MKTEINIICYQHEILWFKRCLQSEWRKFKRTYVKMLLYCSKAVLKFPMSTSKLFIIKCGENDVQGDTAIAMSGKYKKVCRNPVNH